MGRDGELLDIPLPTHKDAPFVRLHYDTITVRLPNASHPEELVIVVVVAVSGVCKEDHHRRTDEPAGAR